MHRTLLPLVVLLGVLMGCTMNDTTLPTTTVSLNENMISSQESPWGLAWREDGIYVLYPEGGLYRWNNHQWEQHTLPERTACRRTVYNYIYSLPDSQLAISLYCISNINTSNILIYNWEVQEGMILLDFELPQAGSFTTNPDMTRFVYQTTNTFSNIYWVEGEELEAIPITLVDGNKRWFLPSTKAAQEQWEADDARIDTRIYNAGILGNTIWSPDGRWLGITATLDPMGKPLSTLGRYKWNLYLVNPETLETSILVNGINDSGAIMGWSPDSGWIAYDEAGTGLWIINVKSQMQHNIYRGKVDISAWSPDGTQMLVVACSTSLCNEYELLILDLSSLVSK